MPKNKKRSAVILRGIPGSGKTTFAQMMDEAKVCSADWFFVNLKTGEYRFDPKQLPDAHAACMQRFIELVVSTNKSIVVDNTNITAIEIAPYVAIAQAYGIPASIVTIDCKPEVANKRQMHGVPLESLLEKHELMLEEEKRFPAWWKHEHFNGARWLGA